MNIRDLQAHLKQTGRYAGAVDGLWGPLTQASTLLLLTDGPDTPLKPADFTLSAARLSVPVKNIRAVVKVEAGGAGFFAGRPLILPEPHRFSKRTGRRFDAGHPDVSYPRWGARPYPKSQDARYTQLLKMISLDVDAGFASASYGRFQIMGENHQACGYATPMAFAEAMARDEPTQLAAFEAFLRANNLVRKLRDCSTDPETCRPFCAGYNGSAYRENRYHEKIAAAIRAEG